jgi:beta-glucuronidase
MRWCDARVRRVLIAVLACLGACAAPAAAAADTPAAKTLYADGADGRYLLGGTWLYRHGAKVDPARASTTGWERVHVPHAWNEGDPSPASMAGTVGWYRKDFELPSASAAHQWIVRFESVNSKTVAWLNGRRIGEHRGPYVPFEHVLKGLRRHGTNRLVIRVDNRRTREDFPPYAETSDGLPSGGWFNYGGILREVYLRRVTSLDLQDVQVLPRVSGTTSAQVTVRARLRNLGPAARTAHVTGTFGRQAFSLGTHTVRPGRAAPVEATFSVRRPRLWTPEDPELYDVRLRAGSAGHRLHAGLRTVDVAGGRLRINGEPLRFRGVGYHEEVPGKGSAIDNDDRAWLVEQARAVGANLMRTHYPPHPQMHELADRLGVLIWSEVPVYQVKNRVLTKRAARRRAIAMLRDNILANGHHPSVLLWSLGNEFSAEAGPSQGAYFREAAAAARRADPTRPVGYAVAGYPSVGCQPEYAPLDVVGLNEYFGWYTGPYGESFDRNKLGPFLDQFRACYPDKAVAVTEFGAEANRDGPAEEKGTWAFQQEFADFHLSTFATKPWLSGVSYWALNEFWVRPGWEGGNPRPQSPMHQKALITFAGQRKPAWETVRRHYAGP